MILCSCVTLPETLVVDIFGISLTMASKIVDKIDPFHNKALIKSRKQKRSQGSSHYRSPGTSELQALPQLKGMCVVEPRTVNWRILKCERPMRTSAAAEMRTERKKCEQRVILCINKGKGCY